MPDRLRKTLRLQGTKLSGSLVSPKISKLGLSGGIAANTGDFINRQVYSDTSTSITTNAKTLVLATYDVDITASVTINLNSDALTYATYDITFTGPTVINLNSDALTYATYDVDIAVPEPADAWFNGQWWVTPTFGSTWWPESDPNTILGLNADTLALSTLDSNLEIGRNSGTNPLVLTTYDVSLDISIINNVYCESEELVYSTYKVGISPSAYTIQYNVDFTTNVDLLTGVYFTKNFSSTQYTNDESFISAAGITWDVFGTATISTGEATLATVGDYIYQTTTTPYVFQNGTTYKVIVAGTAYGDSGVDITIGAGTAVNITADGEYDVVCGAGSSILQLENAGGTNPAILTSVKANLQAGERIAPQSATKTDKIVEYVVYMSYTDGDNIQYTYTYDSATPNYEDLNGTPMGDNAIDLTVCT